MHTPSQAIGISWRTGHTRWVICALLFFAATINYVDRQVIAILKPTLQKEFGWSEIDYGDIVFSFQLAYAIGFLIAGRLIDRWGTRIGFSVFIVVWSLAAMAHAEAPAIGPAAASVLSCVRPRLLDAASPASWRCGSCSGSARRGTSRRRSRRWPSGSRNASARSRPASSTPARTSARS